MTTPENATKDELSVEEKVELLFLDGHRRNMKRRDLWGVAVGYLSTNADEWPATLASRRALYAEYCEEHPLLAKTAESDVLAGDLPTPPTAEKGEKMDKKAKIAQFATHIALDVPRVSDQALVKTKSGQETSHGLALRRVLFVYVSLNSGIGYVQGMHELAAHLYRVLMDEAVGDEAMFVEADTYWMFSALVSDMNLHRLVNHPGDEDGGHLWGGRLADLVELRDEELFAHLTGDRDASPDLLFTFRWFAVLFAMEFSSDDVTRIWDLLLCDPTRFDGLLFMAFAMLSMVRPKLMEASPVDCIGILSAHMSEHINVDALLKRTRTLLAERNAPEHPNTLSPMILTARDKLQKLSTSARKQFDRFANSPTLRRWRSSDPDPDPEPDSEPVTADDIPSPPQTRNTWARHEDDDDDIDADEEERAREEKRKADALARARAASELELDHTAAALVAFELPDVPTGAPVLKKPTMLRKAEENAARKLAAVGGHPDGSNRSGWAERQGRRPTMEDAESVVDDVLKLYPELGEAIGVTAASFYGVYDGHAGARAAAFCAESLLDCLVRDLIANKSRTDEEREASLARAFRLCDEKLLEKSVAESWEDGSTAVVVLQLDDRLYVANAGDAECLLAQATNEAGEDAAHTAKCLTIKHKPTDESERERVQRAGGFVIFGRVGGTLAVSRAFGDRPFKMPYSQTTDDLVTVNPFTATYSFDASHHFLIVACDGLFDVFEYQDVINFVTDLKNDGLSPNDIAEKLVDEALARKTLDNTTAIVVFLGEKVASSSISQSEGEQQTAEVVDVDQDDDQTVDLIDEDVDDTELEGIHQSEDQQDGDEGDEGDEDDEDDKDHVVKGNAGFDIGVSSDWPTPPQSTHDQEEWAREDGSLAAMDEDEEILH